MADIPAALLAQVPPFYAKMADRIWTDLTDQERVRFVHDLTRLAELNAESDAVGEQLLRNEQKRRNQEAILVLQALRAEEARLSPEDETLLTAEWKRLERLLTTERV